MSAQFRRGAVAVDGLAKRPFEQGLLPDEQKEQLCLDLLAEFGATVQRTSSDGEMIHSCVLPPLSGSNRGRHKNNDADASASLNYLNLVFNCQGCGSSGGLLWFIATCRGEDTDSARQWLDNQTGFGADEQSLASLLAFFDAVYSPKTRRTAPIPKMSLRVLEPWLAIHPYMSDPISEQGRGIPEQTLIKFQVGYAPDYRVKTGEDVHGKGIFLASPRIVIPHLWKGDLVGWQTRRLIKDGTAKYLSSPDFPKDTTLYNYDEKASEVIVVESPLSVLATALDGPHVEATFGAKVTDRQCRLLAMHRRLILWMDNDEAGWKATERVAEACGDFCDIWVVNNPWNADPADLPLEERLARLQDLEPYATWHPPTVLYCWNCKRVAHDGEC